MLGINNNIYEFLFVLTSDSARYTLEEGGTVSIGIKLTNQWSDTECVDKNNRTVH